MRAANQHTKMLKLLGYGAAAALLALAPTAASAGKFKVLYSFCTNQICEDGAGPDAPLVMDAGGNLFGTTHSGGKNGPGTAYELKNVGGGKYRFRTIYSFSQSPNNGGLIVDTAGNLYGMYEGGGLYKLTYGFGAHHTKWGLTDLPVSEPGSSGGLVYAGASNDSPWDGSSPLYGVTNTGGTNAVGTVFSLALNGSQWTQTALYNFCSTGGQKCTDGAYPLGRLVLDGAGNVFGTTLGGGGNDNGGLNGDGSGVAFQLSQEGGSWSETVLHAFCAEAQCADGGYPFGLSIDGVGNLFGAAAVGGGKCHLAKNGCGVVFELVPNGGQSQETVLYTFCQKRDCADGAFPAAPPIVTTDGKLLGTTENGGGNDIDGFGEGGGVAYELNGASYQVLHHFCALPNCADGEYPDASLVIGSTVQAIGTASRAGAFNGGDVFSVEIN